jgi:hypothetical protein
MTNSQRNAYVLRDGIMNLLSDEEVAKVSTAETAEKLADGDEYIDLEQLAQGVLRAQSVPTPMGRVLPRKSVHQDTWSKILMQMTSLHAVEASTADPVPTPRNT